MSVLGEENGDATRKKFPLAVMLRAMREVDNGVPFSVACRKVGMVEKTLYRYREKHQGMSDGGPEASRTRRSQAGAFSRRGRKYLRPPEAITVDSGPEFISATLDQWAHAQVTKGPAVRVKVVVAYPLQPPSRGVVRGNRRVEERR